MNEEPEVICIVADGGALAEFVRLMAHLDHLDLVRECDERAWCREMAETIAWLPGERKRCSIGGEPVFYIEATRSYIPGHIHSEDGIAEYGISGCCEFHFDYMMLDLEEEVEDATIWG